MNSNSFERSVMRTVSPLLAKEGLRDVARSNQTTNLLHGIIGLNTEIGGLLQNLQPYLLGFQLNNELLQATFTSLGGVNYYAVLLAKTLKVKVPGSGKKVHLQAMTKTEAVLRLNSLSVDLLYEAMAVFRGEPINTEATATLVEDFLSTIWPMTYDLLGVTPSQVFDSYAERLAAGYPEGLFSDDKEVVKQALANQKAFAKKLIAARKADKAKDAAERKAAKEAAKQAKLAENLDPAAQ
jgi:hypothetical protein